MKKFWFSSDLGRDMMIAEAEDEEHLENAFALVNEQEKEDGEEINECYIESELSEDEYKEHEDGEETMFNAYDYLPIGNNK